MFETTLDERVELTSAAYWVERREDSNDKPLASSPTAPSARLASSGFPTDHLPEGSC